MSLPTTNFDPGFRITRASHVVLTVRDLAASRQFYEKVIGLILTAEEDETLYFRGARTRRGTGRHRRVRSKFEPRRRHHRRRK
jgi:catechol 2,3-dioxygenase-like lactoylglutathione lyase family enzyme